MLKSRDVFPPGGFLYVQKETGWEAPQGVSFNVVVQALIAHRKANPALAGMHHWALDEKTVGNEVDAFNDARCRAHGWLGYVSQEVTSSPFPAARPSIVHRVAAAGEGVKRIAAGVKTLLDWLGKGGRPVLKELAEKRASICAICPKNKTGGLEKFFTVPASEQIRTQLGIKNDLKLETSHDARLNVCEACLCPLRLKVWCPMDHILEGLSTEIRSKLNPENPKCWILEET